MKWSEGLRMAYLGVLESFQVRDAIDILFMSVVIYHLYAWFRGTQAFKALIGLVGLGVIYTGAQLWGLFLTTWSFQILWQVLIILLIILFQSEIRQALERVNPLRIIGFHTIPKSTDWIPRFVEAVFTMAEQRIGALLVIERTDRLQGWVTACFPVSGPPTPELLVSLFQKNSPLHDGAALVRGGKVFSASCSCYLPLTSAEGLPNEWGTRHRAALGLSERCDAWVVVISEERGRFLSLAMDGWCGCISRRSCHGSYLRCCTSSSEKSVERFSALPFHQSLASQAGNGSSGSRGLVASGRRAEFQSCP
jgi:diadenylate cyclase